MRQIRFVEIVVVTLLQCAMTRNGTGAEAYTAKVVQDLPEALTRAVLHNSPDTRVSEEACRAITRRVIFQHPPEKGTATASFRFKLPQRTGRGHLCFISYVALRDGFGIARDLKASPDGVVFGVDANAQRLLRITVKQSGWVPVCLILDSWPGKDVELVLSVNPRANNYRDWAMWGEPMVVLLEPACGEFQVPDFAPAFPNRDGEALKVPQQKGMLLFDSGRDALTFEPLSQSSDADTGSGESKPPLLFFCAYSDYEKSRASGLAIPAQWTMSARLLGIAMMP